MNVKNNFYRPTASSYFSGSGGIDYGLSEAGVEVIQSLEYDQHACDSLKNNFSHEVISKDIREVTVLSQKESDIIVGTYPCTKYSTIADIHGTRTGDDLFLHFFRHVAIRQPEAYVVENVPGMKKFPVVMEAMTKIPGYYLNIFCPLDASNWLPQKRDRLILIGTKKPFFITDPQKSNSRVRLKDVLDPDASNMHVPQYVLNRINGKYRDKPIISDPENPAELAPTCVAHYSKDLGTRLVKDKKHSLGMRPYSVKEYARLQGFPDSFKFSGNQWEQYKQIGNAVAIPVARWIGSEMIRYFNKSVN